MQQSSQCILCGGWSLASGEGRCVSCKSLCAVVFPRLLRLMQVLDAEEFKAGQHVAVRCRTNEIEASTYLHLLR